MKVSVLIAHLDGLDNLRITIDSHRTALGVAGVDYEIIVCDNGSDPDIVAAIEQLPVTLVHETIRGTVAPFQAAARVATGEYLCISDHHILVEPTYYLKQLAILDARPDIGTLYARCKFDLLDNEDYVYHYGWSYHESWRSGFKNDPPSRTEIYPVLVSQMGAPIIRRALFEDFGMFSATAFNKHGGFTGEELCLAVKTWMWGSSVYMNPRATYWHVRLRPEGQFGAAKHQAEAFAVLSYLLGGDKWLDQYCQINGSRLLAPHGTYPNLDIAHADLKAITEADRAWVLAHQHLSFDDLISRHRAGEMT